MTDVSPVKITIRQRVVDQCYIAFKNVVYTISSVDWRSEK